MDEEATQYTDEYQINLRIMKLESESEDLAQRRQQQSGS